MSKSFDEAINKICKQLPKNWNIFLELEEGSAWVKLTNPYGDEEDFSSNMESVIEILDDALDYAIEHVEDFELRYKEQYKKERYDES